MNRRGFLKSLGALAACAVAGPALSSLVPSEQGRLVAMMRTGLVENQTFVFDGPIVLDIDNLLIRGCRLIFLNLKPNDVAITINCSRLMMVNNVIDCRGNGIAMKVMPQGDADMTSTIQSAISTMSNSKSETERLLAFATGTYLVNSPIKA